MCAAIPAPQRAAAIVAPLRLGSGAVTPAEKHAHGRRSVEIVTMEHAGAHCKRHVRHGGDVDGERGPVGPLDLIWRAVGAVAAAAANTPAGGVTQEALLQGAPQRTAFAHVLSIGGGATLSGPWYSGAAGIGRTVAAAL